MCAICVAVGGPEFEPLGDRWLQDLEWVNALEWEEDRKRERKRRRRSRRFVDDDEDEGF